LDSSKKFLIVKRIFATNLVQPICNSAAVIKQALKLGADKFLEPFNFSESQKCRFGSACVLKEDGKLQNATLQNATPKNAPVTVKGIYRG